MQRDGVWLQIGGGNGNGYGTAPIEVCVSKGGEAWEWRKLTDAEKGRLIQLWNADQERLRKIGAGECLFVEDLLR